MTCIKYTIQEAIDYDGLYPAFEDFILALENHISFKDNAYDDFQDTYECINLNHSLELLKAIAIGLDKDYHNDDAEIRFNLTKEIMAELCKINVNREL